MFVLFTVPAAVLALVAAVWLTLRYYPPFGGRPSEGERRAIARSSNFNGGSFAYPLPTKVGVAPTEMAKVMVEMLRPAPDRKPAGMMPVVKPDLRAIAASAEPSATWLGHSAVLLRLDGKTLLLDPMLGRTPSPFSFAGGKRYGGRPPVEPEDLPAIDAVILSHDHYDHLDYGTIRRLAGRVRRYIVPLGVGAHLRRWGVDSAIVSEHDWSDELRFEGIRLACAPARHFSGRGLSDRNKTLWCSWVIAGNQGRVFFSGDSGYGPHFREIGERYGPFDLTLMECGQYDERWAAIHMLPEQTVQAHLDVRGRLFIPIHWGAFTLALHGWSEPPERALRAAEARGVSIALPRIGETVRIGAADVPAEPWWR